MSEIYDTVTAQCDIDMVSKFPVEQDGNSEDTTKLNRSLTEKRKNYVRRVSSKVAYLEPQTKFRNRHQTTACSADEKYTTFRSWKSFKRTRNRSNASGDADEVDYSPVTVDPSEGQTSLECTAGCLDITRPPQARDSGLLDVCLLVGLNHMTGRAYVKSVFPGDVQVPPHIENLVFPETLCQSSYDLEPIRTQRYSLVLTNERGERSFAYCRRVLPEGAGFCLPLAYCLISRVRAPGFYYKVLQEIESHHGISDQSMNSLLQELFEKDFPNPGELITLTNLRSPRRSFEQARISVRKSIEAKSKTLEPRRTSKVVELAVSDSELDLSATNLDEVRIKRPIEPRLDEDNLSVLLDAVGVNLLLKIFGTMLLERKVVLVSDNLSQLSSCIEALQAIIYPLVWQQPLVSIIPPELTTDMLEAPLPILAGSLRCRGSGELTTVQFEEGMLIELSRSGAKVVFEQGDESTILPPACYKTLKAALQLESSKNLVGTEQEVEKARNVLIAEAFLRFFVDILADLWQHFKCGKRRRESWEEAAGEEDVVVFDKEQMISQASNKQTQYFLEWFTETAIFNHLVQNMCKCYPLRAEGALEFSSVEGLVDTPYPSFYEVFEERIARRQLLSSGKKKNAEVSGKNVKNALNKKIRLLKTKLKDLVN